MGASMTGSGVLRETRWLGVTTPFLVFVAWYGQRQRETGPQAPEPVLPRVAQQRFGVIGAGVLLVSVGLFLMPTVVARVWPWTVTPLTARVVSAMFSLTGVVAIGMALDPRWPAFRILAEAQVFSIALILLAVWRDQADIHFGSPSAWIFTLGLIGVMGLLIALSIAMDRRARTWSGSAVPA